MNWVLNIKIPFFNDSRRKQEVEELRKNKLRLMVMEEKKQAEELIRVLEKSNRIREDI
jgi:hypothetical protein